MMKAVQTGVYGVNQSTEALQEKKKYTLKNVRWNRVAFALIVLFGFGYGVISFIGDIVQAYPAWSEERSEQYYQEELSKYDQVEVTLYQGDTAWQIQRELAPSSKDIRHELHLVRKLNGIDRLGNIKAGESLIFLKEKAK